MKKTILFLGCCLLGWGANNLFAQQGNAAAGGDATGAGGMVSYTIGLVDYINATSNSGTITQGLQQPGEPGGVLTLSGNLTYDNVFATALNNCTVQLKSGNTVVTSVTTDASGYFVFNNPEPGTYSLNGVTTQPWGSCNATDALLILKHFTGANLLTGLRKTAADLDGSNFINATDALQAMKRFVGLQSSFVVGDWAFEHPFIDVDGINSFSQNFKGICFGDVDGSYIPGFKAEPTIFLVSQGSQLLNNNQTVVVPVRINESMTCAAMSLIMNFPSNNLEIMNVEATYDNQNLLFNTIGNELRIAWNTLQPKNLNKNEVILNITLKLKNSDNTNLGFTLNPESTIADYNGITILNKTLSMPTLVDSKQGFSLSQNVPNPFTQVTQISYVLPEDGNVKLELLDMIGQQLSVMQENQVKAGTHTYNFSGNSLPNGIYFYRMNVTTGSQTYTQTKRMIISR